MIRLSALAAMASLLAGLAHAETGSWRYGPMAEGYSVHSDAAGQAFRADDVAEYRLGDALVAFAFLRVLPSQYELTLANTAEPFAAARVRGQHDCDTLSFDATEALSPSVNVSVVRMTCLRNGTARPVVVNLHTLHALPWASDR